MAVTKKRIEKNLQSIRGRIADACARSNRSSDQVALIAVTKTVEAVAIRSLLELGQVDIGESRPQQLVQRAEEIAGYLQRRRSGPLDPPRWHMIGHLQRNKARSLLQTGAVIHSLDSLRLAEEVDSRSEQLGLTTEVLLQVNCSEEKQKFGCAVGAAVHLGEMIASMKHLRLTGLMTMASLADDPEQARPTFIRLRELFEEMEKLLIGGDDFRHMSMGMSQDYAVAVEEGATIVRIGTALFE